MATFRERLPSRRDILLLFAACAFVVHVWAILNLLWELPAWTIRAGPWDVAGMVAYTLLTAFVESLIVLLLLLFLSAILPARFVRGRLVALGTAALLVASVWAIGLHYDLPQLAMPAWPQAGGWLWGLVCLALLVLASLLVYRHNRLGRAIESSVERVAILSGLYILLDVLSLGIVVLRNV